MSDNAEWPPPTEQELRGMAAERADDEERERRRARGDWGTWPRTRDLAAEPPETG